MDPSARNDAARYAEELFQRASETEARVTLDLLDIATQTGTNLGATFVRDGKVHSTLDTRLKTVESIDSKIRSLVRQLGVAPEIAASDIKDSLRYTFVLDASSYGMKVAELRRALCNAGYEPLRFSDSWLLGHRVNTLWRTPAGVLVEVQFHTQSTLEGNSQPPTL